MKKTIIFFTGIVVALVGVYVSLPNAIDLLGFSGSAFFSGEVWRIITFPFVHVSNAHLVENLLALFILTLLSYEFKMKVRAFVSLFFASGILLAFFGGLVYPYLVIVGSSLGVYSIFGALTIKGQDYIPRYVLPSLFAIFIIMNVFYNYFTGDSFVQPLYHAIAFVVGAGLFSLGKRTKVLE
ncbi:rhomboid family intramembrane serine protease [archaeon]|jgi:membrane associated rhomboid family serine protease|nr:rhomboid family intramembrane serine protease [archaeon]MBT3731359.1 rhomboid family intramembrane serine protease [archaeon]MBT4670338.1 rhomboid family intramembrane serine protease [archaeon]MBT5029644.1 rhomboid family intramembrane serine protease [archaeon]MBT5287607.1 rhomboid family intramembrane serine protease [archaeon]